MSRTYSGPSGLPGPIQLDVIEAPAQGIWELGTPRYLETADAAVQPLQRVDPTLEAAGDWSSDAPGRDRLAITNGVLKRSKRVGVRCDLAYDWLEHSQETYLSHSRSRPTVSEPYQLFYSISAAEQLVERSSLHGRGDRGFGHRRAGDELQRNVGADSGRQVAGGFLGPVPRQRLIAAGVAGNGHRRAREQLLRERQQRLLGTGAERVALRAVGHRERRRPGG